jgi:hypothetical protein
MPIKPESNETEQDFISRCMSDEKDAFPEQDQRLAVCYSYWDKEGMSSEMEKFKDLPTTDCIEQAKSAGYTEDYAKLACSKPKKNDGQQGGVVAQAMARTKFEYPPKSKESMNDFIGRCMSDSMVREKKKDRIGRAQFCYRMYQDFYVMSIGKSWK